MSYVLDGQHGQCAADLAGDGGWVERVAQGDPGGMVWLRRADDGGILTLLESQQAGHHGDEPFRAW